MIEKWAVNDTRFLIKKIIKTYLEKRYEEN